MGQGTKWIAAAILTALLAGTVWVIGRAPTHPDTSPALPELSSNPSTDREAGTELEIPQSALSSDSNSTPAGEHRVTTEAALPADFETIYRYKTWDELVAREEELGDLIQSVGGDHVLELVAQGKYIREEDEVPETGNKDRYYEGGRMHCGVAGNPNVPPGVKALVVFEYLDWPATAVIERERLFVRAKMKEVRKLEDDKKRAAAKTR